MGIGYASLTTNLSADGNIIIYRYTKPTIRYISSSYTGTFKDDSYRDNIKNIYLGERIQPPEDVYQSWDIGEVQNGSVMAYLTINPEDASYYDLYIQGRGRLYANSLSSYLFANLKGVDNIYNLEVLDTSGVTIMVYMFYNTGYNSTSFTLNLGENFNTSNVRNMNRMFYQMGFVSFTLTLPHSFSISSLQTSTDIFSGWQSYSTVNVRTTALQSWVKGKNKKINVNVLE